MPSNNDKRKRAPKRSACRPAARGQGVRPKQAASDAMDELQARETALRGVLNATQESIWLFSADGILRLANETALKRFGMSAEEMIGKHVNDLLPPDLAKTRLSRLNDVVRTGNPVEFEDLRAGILFRHTFSPVFDSRGNVTDVAIYSRDITRQRENEARLAGLASFPQLDPNPIVEADMAGRITYANPSAYSALARLGLSSTETNAFVPADMNAILEAWDRKTPSTVDREITIADRVFKASAYLEPGLGVARIYIYDSTESKRAEVKLRKSLERFEILSLVAGGLLRTSAPQTLVESLCSKVMAHLDCHAFFNYLVDAPTGRLHLNACAGIPDEEATRIEWLDFGVAVCGCVARDGNRIVAERIQTTPDERTDLVRSYGIRAYACHPILGPDDKVMGTLSFGTRSRDAFSDEDLSLMRAVTDQVAVAMIRMINEKDLRRSEEKYRLLFQNMGEGFALYELLYDGSGAPVDWRVLEVNDAYVHHTGISRDRVVGRRMSEIFPAAIPEYLPRFAEVVAAQKPAEFETYSQVAQRHHHIVSFPAGPHRFANTVTDITERKLAEEATIRSKQTFVELVERAPFGIYTVDARFRIAQMNLGSQHGAFRNVRPVIGRDLGEVMRILWPEPVAAEIIAHFRHTLDTGEPYYSPRFTSPRHDAGIVESYEWELHRMMLPDGQYGVICYYYDSTKLREAEQALRQSEERMQLALRVSRSFTFDWQSATDTVIRSASCAGVLRLSGDEATHDTGKHFFERVHPDDRGRFLRVLGGLRPAADSYITEYRVLRGDGSTALLEEVGRGSFDDTGKLARLTGVTTDITDRKLAEEALKEREQKYRTLIDRMIDGFALHEIVLDASGLPRDYRFLEVNKAFERLTGLRGADIIGKCVTQVLPDIRESEFDWISAYGKVALTGEELRTEQYSEELKKWYSITAYSPEKGLFATIFEDITARKKAEDMVTMHGKQLTERNDELARFNRVAVDRELRMIELKKEINAALAEAGRPRRYPLAFENGPET